MKKLILAVSIIGFIFLQGCSNDTKKEENNDANIDAALLPTEKVGTDSVMTNPAGPSGMDVQQNATPGPQVQPTRHPLQHHHPQLP